MRANYIITETGADLRILRGGGSGQEFFEGVFRVFEKATFHTDKQKTSGDSPPIEPPLLRALITCRNYIPNYI